MKTVQVKEHVHDPDFPEISLGGNILEYVESNGNVCLFKFKKVPKEIVAKCNKKNFTTNLIHLNRKDVYWHKKDWTYANTLSCYSAVKRRRG